MTDQPALDAAGRWVQPDLAQKSHFASGWDAARSRCEAENERLRGEVAALSDKAWEPTRVVAEEYDRIRAENERLRAALTEMLESFTEPEDDNDILRRARAALGRNHPKADGKS